MSLSITELTSDIFYKIGQNINLRFKVVNTSITDAVNDMKTTVSLYPSGTIIPSFAISPVLASLTSQEITVAYTTSVVDIQNKGVNFNVAVNGLVTSVLFGSTIVTTLLSDLFTNFQVIYNPISLTVAQLPTQGSVSFFVGDTIDFNYGLYGSVSPNLGVISIETTTSDSSGTKTTSFSTSTPLPTSLPPSFGFVGKYNPTITNDFVFSFTAVFTGGGIVIRSNTLTTNMTYIPLILDSPSVSITATTAGINNYSQPGQSINVNILIEINGNVVLKNGIVNLGSRIIANISPIIYPILGPPSSPTYLGTFQVTQEDIDAGSFSQQLSVTFDSYISLSGNVVNTPTTSIFNYSIPALPTPGISAIASGSQIFPKIGEIYLFNVNVKNTGNVTLSSIVLSSTSGATFNNTSGVLSPSLAINFTGSQIVKSSDLVNGILTCDVSVSAYRLGC
jgi:hypothetical protein